ncbi:hypothetical protein ES707_11738 [subsurface metagenome]
METPVLFLIFNRPVITYKVFKKIKNVKPKKLYIAADGPRENNINDKVNCKKAREVINKIDWDCEVKTLFRDKNLGFPLAISLAIDWFFKNEEMGIILEDDCLPDPSFFYFCQELLQKYKDDARIMMISGFNYLINSLEIRESYFFSNYYCIWGWATWRRAWKLYDIEMKNWDYFKENNNLVWIYKDKRLAEYVYSLIQSTYDGFIDTWDVQWFFTCITQNGLSIVPSVNLISNIGWIGAHFNGFEKDIHNTPTKSIDIRNMIHPEFVFPDMKYNQILFDNIRKKSNNLIIRKLQESNFKIIKLFFNVLYPKLKKIIKGNKQKK